MSEQDFREEPTEEPPLGFGPGVTVDITNVPVIEGSEFREEESAAGFQEEEPTLLEKMGENFKQQAGGILEAAQNIVDLVVNKPARALSEATGIGGFDFSTGQHIPPEQTSDIKIPQVDKPKDLGGALNRGVMQFVTGFIPVLAASRTGQVAEAATRFAEKMGVPAAKAVGRFLETEIAAVVADQVAFDPQQPRFSNFIQQFPELQNPVTEYLAADPKDSEAQNRFELALEGAGLGVALQPFVALMRGFRAGARQHVLAQADEAAIEDVAPRTSDVGSGREEVPAGTAKLARENKEPRRAGNINLDRINSPEDAKQVILEASQEQAGKMEAARRGVISTDQTRLLASDLGMTESALLKRRKGQAFNAEEALAARNLLAESAERVVDLSKAARGGSDEAVVSFQQALTRHVAIQEQVAGLTAEAGRALRQFQIPSESKERVLREIIESQGGRDRIDKIADLASRLDTPEQVAVFTRGVRKATTLDKIFEVWINGLLSGPQTHAVNTLSNSLVALWTIPEHLLAAGIRGVRGGKGVTFRDTQARIFGMVEGMKDGLRAGAKAFITEEPSDIFSKLDVPNPKAIPGVVGKVVRLPGRALVAEDEFFKTIGFRMELRSLAMRTGLERGLRGNDLAKHINEVITNPPEKIKLAALDTARYQTFTNPLGDVGQKIQGIRNSDNPLVAAPARLLVPFLRTPLNILKFAAGRSVLAPLSRNFRADIKKGGAARDLALARMTIGTGVSAVVASYAAEGKITGGGPKDPELRQALFNTGWQPYSLKIGDKYFSYARLEPLGILFGVAADYAEISGHLEKGEQDELAGMISMAVAKNVISKTYLKSISETIQALHDPDRYGERYLQNLSGTLIPTGVAQLARTEDPILRDVRSFQDKIKSRLPGYSEDLPARRNVWGSPISLTGGLGPDIISPIYTNKASKDKLANEVVRLKLELTMPPRKISGIELTPQQYWSYVEAAGKPAKRILDAAVTSEGWDALGSQPGGRTAQEDFIKETVRRWRQLARVRLFAENPDLFKKQVEKRVKERTR